MIYLLLLCVVYYKEKSLLDAYNAGLLETEHFPLRKDCITLPYKMLASTIHTAREAIQHRSG